MSSILDPVQITALEFARNKSGVGFFLEQGLGKSLLVLTEFDQYYQLSNVDRMIVITPNTFKQGFVDEIAKHNFDFDAHVFRTAKRAAATEFCAHSHNGHAPVMIVNYEAARLKTVLAGLIQWAQRGRAYLVIDESIQIKSHNSAQTKAVHQLARACPYVRILTGRPQTQGPHDLWGQLRAIGLFTDRNFYAFRGLFCQMGGWQDKQVVAAKNAPQLAALMAPHVFQAKKKDWLPGLPRKDATIRDYEMSGEQKAQYQSMEKEFLLELEDETITVDVAIAKYEKLAQIQTGFIYDDEHVVHELVELSENPRINLLRQILEEEVSGKTVVVYRHRAMLPVLTDAFSQYNPAWIKGGMKPDEVEEQKLRFNTEPGCRILLAQAEASKFGHTLCLQPDDDKCRTMIFFENSYSLDTRSQIEDRIHRRGQTGEYVLYIDFSGSDLDRRIVRALQRKEELYKSVFKNLREMAPA